MQIYIAYADEFYNNIQIVIDIISKWHRYRWGLQCQDVSKIIHRTAAAGWSGRTEPSESKFGEVHQVYLYADTNYIRKLVYTTIFQIKYSREDDLL